MRTQVFLIAAGMFVIVLGGCTVHPPGEQEQRNAAKQAGTAYEKRVGQRQVPPLPNNPTPEELVRYALLSNADLEQRYWEWRSAIEQIPQDGMPETTLAINAAQTVIGGRTGLLDTVLTAQNMPSMMIPWPGKLTAAARRALENARAAGMRFEKAKFDLRNKVLGAYYDYARTAELIRLEETNAELLQTTAMVVEARNRAGTGGQQDLLKARNELDLSRNDIANMQAQLPALRAALNSLLSRDVDSALPVPSQLPATRPMAYSDDQLLELAVKQNPELAALAYEIRGKKEGVRLARLQYMPDFSVSASTDLGGIAQTLTGMVTVPLFRYQAINAAIAQAEANLKSTEAMRRQAHNDLSAQVVIDITTLRDADRQVDLLEHTILPSARQIIMVARLSYETGKSSLLDVLDNQRSLIAIQRLATNLRITREKRLANLEAIAAFDLAESPANPASSVGTSKP